MIPGLALCCAVLAGPGTLPAAAAATRRVVPTTVLAVSARQLPEVSGCSVSRRDPNRVWLHNDSGDVARVVPVDLRTGKVGSPVVLQGIDPTDDEDIASTPSGDLVLADIGDNDAQRATVRLYRFPEPRAGAVTARASTIELRYPDGPHDAEALVITPDGSAALVITKSATGIASVYRAELGGSSAGSGVQTMEALGTITISGESLFFPNLVTAADTLADGRGIVLRTYQFGYLLRVPPGGAFTDALRAAPVRFELPAMIQGEAICSSVDGRAAVTASEARGAPTFPLARLAMPR